MKLKPTRIDSYIFGAPLAATVALGTACAKLESKKATRPVGYIGNRVATLLIPAVSFPLIAYSFLKELIAKASNYFTGSKKFADHATRGYRSALNRVSVCTSSLPLMARHFEKGGTFEGAKKELFMKFKTVDYMDKLLFSQNPQATVVLDLMRNPEGMANQPVDAFTQLIQPLQNLLAPNPATPVANT